MRSGYRCRTEPFIQVTNLFAHSKSGHHQLGDLCGAVEVARGAWRGRKWSGDRAIHNKTGDVLHCTGCDVLGAEYDLLRHAAPHADVYLSQQLRAGLAPAVVLRQHGHLRRRKRRGFKKRTPSFEVKGEFSGLCFLTCPKLGPRGMMVALLMGMASLV